MSDCANFKIDNDTYPCKDASVRNPTFTEASTRANIASGDSIFTILGKLKKWYTDLKSVAFSGSYNDLSNKPSIPSLNWTYYGQTTGITQMGVPSSFNDLLIRTTVTVPDLTFTLNVQQIFNRNELPNTGGDFYDVGSLLCMARMYVSKVAFTLNYAGYNNTDYTSTAVTKIYYR